MLGFLWMNSVLGKDEGIAYWHMKEMVLGNFLSVLSAQGFPCCSQVHKFYAPACMQNRSYLYCLNTEWDSLLQLYTVHPHQKSSCAITDLHPPLTCSHLGMALGLYCLTHLALPVWQQCGVPGVLIFLCFCISASVSNPREYFQHWASVKSHSCLVEQLETWRRSLNFISLMPHKRLWSQVM